MKWLFTLSMLVLLKVAFAQDPTREYDLESLAEKIFPSQDLDIDYSQLYENLAQILSNPIDLNSATDEQLRSLFVLNEIQITNLLNYRNTAGPFISVYELQSIPSFDQVTFELLAPFVTVRSPLSGGRSLIHRILNEQNNYLLLRYNRTIEDRRGFATDGILPPKYNGSADRLYTRFRVARASDFSLGFTLEKDAGEKINWLPRKNWYGFDHTSYHFQVQQKGILNNLILGDYQAQFGQGLVLGSGFGMGKGAETITTIRRSSTGFSPYTSLSESGFFRGVAMSVQPHKKLRINTFFSRAWIDGSGTDSTNQSFSSVLSSGFHRTETEIRNRKSLLETNFGIITNYKTQNLEIGSIIHHTHFGIPIFRNQTPYNRFYFQGANNTNVSLYLNYSWNNMTFFSEGAQTLGEGKAYVLGILTSITPQFDLAFAYRHYQRDFQPLYGNGFAENTATQNEMGYYFGWKYKFNKQHTLAGYTDLFQFPWLRFRSYAPSTGHEWLSRYTYQPSKSITFYAQVREESKARNMSSDTNLYLIENGVKRNYLINLDYTISQLLSFKSRIQASSYSIGNLKTSGLAVIQDLNFKVRKFTFSTRYALFDTDDYDNRQYVYEKDVWLAYSFPAYYGIGVRSYILMQYSISSKIDLWIKWARVRYEDRESIGSGNETIEGNSMNDVKLQARIRF